MSAKSGRQLARQLSGLPADTELACLECFPNGLPFYLNRTATLISRNGSELTSNYIISCLEKEPQWPPQIVPVAGLEGWLTSRTNSIYLIVKQSDRSRLESIAAARRATVQPLVAGLRGRAHSRLPEVCDMCGICGTVAVSGLADTEAARLRVEAMLRLAFAPWPGCRRPRGHRVRGSGRDAAGDPRPGSGQSADGGPGERNRGGLQRGDR